MREQGRDAGRARSFGDEFFIFEQIGDRRFDCGFRNENDFVHDRIDQRER